MLKNNSTAAELSDLMIEYEILKEVNHPNIVRLMGACTTNDGPVYILIEYCKYGSLRYVINSFLSHSLGFNGVNCYVFRAYLRRSRPIAVVIDGVSRVAELPADYDLSGRLLLRYAWQVCKGMEYLTKLKVQSTQSVFDAWN